MRQGDLQQQARPKGAERLHMAFNGMFPDPDVGQWRPDKHDVALRSSLTASTTTRTSIQSMKTPNSTLRRSLQASSGYERATNSVDTFTSPVRSVKAMGYSNRSPAGQGYAKRHSNRTGQPVTNSVHIQSASKQSIAVVRKSSPSASPAQMLNQTHPVTKPSPMKPTAAPGATTSAVIAALAMDAALPDLDATAMALLETIMGASIDATAAVTGGLTAAPHAPPTAAATVQAPSPQPPAKTGSVAAKHTGAVAGQQLQQPLLTQQLLSQHQQQYASQQPQTAPGDLTQGSALPPASNPLRMSKELLAHLQADRSAAATGSPRDNCAAGDGASLHRLSTQHNNLHGAGPNDQRGRSQQPSHLGQAQAPPALALGQVSAGGWLSETPASPRQPPSGAAFSRPQTPDLSPVLKQSAPTQHQHQQHLPAAGDSESSGESLTGRATRLSAAGQEAAPGASQPALSGYGSDGGGTPVRRPSATQSVTHITHGLVCPGSGGGGGDSPSSGGGATPSSGGRALNKRLSRSHAAGTLSNKALRLAAAREEGRRPTTYAELQAAAKLHSCPDSPASPIRQSQQQQQPQPLAPLSQQRETLTSPPPALQPTGPSSGPQQQPSRSTTPDSRPSLAALVGSSSKDLAAAAAAYSRTTTARGSVRSQTLSERKPSAGTSLIVQAPLTVQKPASHEKADAAAEGRRDGVTTAKRRLFGGLFACFGCCTAPSSPPAGGTQEPSQGGGAARLATAPQPPALQRPAGPARPHRPAPPPPPPPAAAAAPVAAPTRQIPAVAPVPPQPQMQSAVAAVTKALALSPASAAAATAVASAAGEPDTRLLSLLRADCTKSADEGAGKAAGGEVAAATDNSNVSSSGTATSSSQPRLPADKQPAVANAGDSSPRTLRGNRFTEAAPTSGSAAPPPPLPAVSPFSRQPAGQQKTGDLASSETGAAATAGVGASGCPPAVHDTLSPNRLRHEDCDSVLRGSVDTNPAASLYRSPGAPLTATKVGPAPSATRMGGSTVRPGAAGAVVSAGVAADAGAGSSQPSNGTTTTSGVELDAAAILSYCSSSSIQRARMLMAQSAALSAKSMQQQQTGSATSAKQPAISRDSATAEAAPPPSQHQPAPPLPPPPPQPPTRPQRYSEDEPADSSPFSAAKTTPNPNPTASVNTAFPPSGSSAFMPGIGGASVPRGNRKRGRATNPCGSGLSQLDARKLATLPLEEMLDRIQAAIHAEDVANGRAFHSTSGGGLSDDGSILPMPPVLGKNPVKSGSLRRRKSNAGGGRATGGGNGGNVSANHSGSNGGSSRGGGRSSDGGTRSTAGVGAVRTVQTKTGSGSSSGGGRRRRRVKPSSTSRKPPPQPFSDGTFAAAAALGPPSPNGKKTADVKDGVALPVWRPGGRAIATTTTNVPSGGTSTSPHTAHAGSAALETSLPRQPPYKKPLLSTPSGNAVTLVTVTAGGGVGGSPCGMPPTSFGQLPAAAALPQHQQQPYSHHHHHHHHHPGSLSLTSAAKAAGAVRSSSNDGPARKYTSPPPSQLAIDDTAAAPQTSSFTAAQVLATSPSQVGGSSGLSWNAAAGLSSATPFSATVQTSTPPIKTSLAISELLSRAGTAASPGAASTTPTSQTTPLPAATTADLSQLLRAGLASGLTPCGLAGVSATSPPPAVVPVMNFQLAASSAASHLHDAARQGQLVNSLLGGPPGAPSAKPSPSKPRIVSVSLTELLLRAKKDQQPRQTALQRLRKSKEACGKDVGSGSVAAGTVAAAAEVPGGASPAMAPVLEAAGETEGVDISGEAVLPTKTDDRDTPVPEEEEQVEERQLGLSAPPEQAEVVVSARLHGSQAVPPVVGSAATARPGPSPRPLASSLVSLAMLSSRSGRALAQPAVAAAVATSASLSGCSNRGDSSGTLPLPDVPAPADGALGEDELELAVEQQLSAAAGARSGCASLILDIPQPPFIDIPADPEDCFQEDLPEDYEDGAYDEEDEEDAQQELDSGAGHDQEEDEDEVGSGGGYSPVGRGTDRRSLLSSPAGGRDALSPSGMIRSAAGSGMLSYRERLQTHGSLAGSSRQSAQLPHYALPIRSRATSAAGESSSLTAADTSIGRSSLGGVRQPGGSSGGGSGSGSSSNTVRHSAGGGSYAQMAVLRQTALAAVCGDRDHHPVHVYSDGGESGCVVIRQGPSSGGGASAAAAASACGSGSPLRGSPGGSSVVGHLPSTLAHGPLPSARCALDEEVESAAAAVACFAPQLQDTADSGEAEPSPREEVLSSRPGGSSSYGVERGSAPAPAAAAAAGQSPPQALRSSVSEPVGDHEEAEAAAPAVVVLGAGPSPRVQ